MFKLLTLELLQMFMVEMVKTSFKLQLTTIFQELVLIELKKEKVQNAQHQIGLLSTGELQLEMVELLMVPKKREMEDHKKLL
jgi:hypothetical protein